MRCAFLEHGVPFHAHPEQDVQIASALKTHTILRTNYKPLFLKFCVIDFNSIKLDKLRDKTNSSE